ncbi:hypothetical protein F5Y02DRAFT_403488 [Annulohypoxylon stygium]|nr:hypothetical protein F5Y02DRAFT_403488 [Annulohypoxylon stygium]
MAGDSSNSIYHGATPPKPSHLLSDQPPTPHPVDDQSLRNYRLESYRRAPDSVPSYHQDSILSNTQEPHHEKVAAELDAIMARLKQK